MWLVPTPHATQTRQEVLQQEMPQGQLELSGQTKVMRSLDEIAVACGTDKATVFTRTYAKPKGFTVHYERFFAQLRTKPIKLLEIGAAGGESIRMWLEFFPKAEIRGIDIVSGTNPYNTPGVVTHPRYQFLQGDQTDKTMWACALANWGQDFNIIVDDGGHFNDGIITTFGCLWSAVKPGGYYAVEDLGCGFTPGSVFIKPGFPDHKTWLHAIVDRLMMGANDIDSAYFANELLILRKR